MKRSKLASALRREPLPGLAREAVWRTVRSTRKAAFRVLGSNRKTPCRFHPIGYYHSQQDAFSAHDRQNLIAYADAVVAGRFPMLGYGSPALGAHPNWHCDWVSHKSWPLVASRKLQIVRHDGSDVKAPWELSRLQWSPVVAKAWALTGDLRYRQMLQSLLTDWIVQNPLAKGINWTVAMEAALRSISLCLTMELLWPFAEEEQPWLNLLEKSLWQHFRFIEVHNEFSWLVRSNHYLSNVVGLMTLSAYLRGGGMERKRARFAQAVQREVLTQTYADGGDREASTGYHLLVAQMALHSLTVQKRAACTVAPEFEARLNLMFEWMAAVADDHCTLPTLGDCDNGRVELTAEDIAGLHADYRPGMKVSGLKRTLDPVSILHESGIAVMRAGDASVVFCVMPNGLAGIGSHTHCDKLSFLLRLEGKAETHEVFCDSGSRCYTRSAELRNYDRSTPAHNTLMIDEREQNTFSRDPGQVFQMGNEATVSPITRLDGEAIAVQASHQGYASLGIEHQRTIQLGGDSLGLIDSITGPTGGPNHVLDLYFILGPEWSVSSERMVGDTVNCRIQGPWCVTLACEAASSLLLTISATEIAREYGSAQPATSIRIRTSAGLPATLRTTVNWS